MSHPEEPNPVKLIASLFSPDRKVLGEAKTELSEGFGPMDWVSPEFFFDRTRYYEKEMGWPLYRLFVSFERLIRPEELVKVKWHTNDMEVHHSRGGKRQVNIDPGYICAERLILATAKNYTHRIYLAKGIYADLTLVFKRGSFRALEWTYPDYADPNWITAFNDIRTRYMEQIREGRRLD